MKQVIANRPQAGAKAATASTAATTNPVTFQDWLFFGQAPNIFVNVGIVPTSSNVVVEYAVVVLQTPSEYVLCDAAINYSNPAAGVAANLATDSGTYDIGTYGTSVQAWAYVYTNMGEQYSSVQDYTVSS
jgi:hypothetical protein